MVDLRQMRLSTTTLLVLRAMLDDPRGRQYGLELIARSGVRSGSLYPILYRLELEGWIAGQWEEIDEVAAGRRRRRYYLMTALGERAATATLAHAVARFTPPAAMPASGQRLRPAPS